MRAPMIVALLVAGILCSCGAKAGSGTSSSTSAGATGTAATTAGTHGTVGSGTSGISTGTSANATGSNSTGATAGTSGNSTATTGTGSSSANTTGTSGSSGTTGVAPVCPSATDALPSGAFTVNFTGAPGDPAGACSGPSVYRQSYLLQLTVPERLHLHVSNGAVASVTIPGCPTAELSCGTDTFTDLPVGDYVVSFESPSGAPAPAVVRHELNPTDAIDCAHAVALEGVDTESHGSVLNGFQNPDPAPNCTSLDGGSYFDALPQGVWFSIHVDVASNFTAELRSDPYADLVLIDGTSCSGTPALCAASQGGAGFSSDIFTQLSTPLAPGDYRLAMVADSASLFRGGTYALYTHLEPQTGNTPQPEPDPSLICVADGPVMPSGAFTVIFDGGLGVNPIGCGGDAGYRQVFHLPEAPNPIAVRLTGPSEVSVQLREPGCLGEGYASYCSSDPGGDAGVYADNTNEPSGPLAVIFSESGAPAQMSASFYELPAGNYDCADAATIELGTHEYQAYTGQPFTQPPATVAACQGDGGGVHYPGASGAYFRIDVPSLMHFHADLYTNNFADLVLTDASSCGGPPIACAPGDSSCFFTCSYSTTFDTSLPAGSYFLQVVSEYVDGDHYGLFTTLGP